MSRKNPILGEFAAWLAGSMRLTVRSAEVSDQVGLAEKKVLEEHARLA
jgi:hypothetical protein